MITESYISFEVAKLLKEKGFDESVTHYYFTQITHVGIKDYPIGVLYTDSYPQHQNNYKNKVAAPTQQRAMKWLREIHNIVIVVVPSMFWGKYNVSIHKKDNNYPIGFDGDSLCPSYEQACGVAIKYCLENLI